jgi:hypothetical protein
MFLRGSWVRALGQTADVRGDELSVGSTIRVHRLCWRALVLAMVTWNPLGAVLYPLELALVGRLKEGPSTELMLCRRLPDP